MKKLVAITGGLLAAALLLIIFVLKRPGQNLETGPAATSEPVQVVDHPAPLSPTQPAQEPTDALLTPTETNQPVRIVIPPHTANRYTAAIETVYADPSHVLFQVRLTGGEISFGDEHFYDRIGSPDLYDETGAMSNTSGGWGPTIDPPSINLSLCPSPS